MAFDVKSMMGDMLHAAAGALDKKWPAAKDYAESEFQKIAQSIVAIGKLTAAGTISREEAVLQLEIQKNASRAILCTIEGLGILAVEAAINAALDVIKSTVNTALGWALL